VSLTVLAFGSPLQDVNEWDEVQPDNPGDGIKREADKGGNGEQPASSGDKIKREDTGGADAGED